MKRLFIIISTLLVIAISCVQLLVTIGTTSTTTCESNTVPINTEKYGQQVHKLLFPRAEIPGIQSQVTADGQRLRTLTSFDGRLHFGYGDESTNAGPIQMYSYDPPASFARGQRGKWLYHGFIDTEEVGLFKKASSMTNLKHNNHEKRSNGNALYTVDIDGHGEIKHDAVYVHQLKCGRHARWTTVGKPIQAPHIYSLVVVQDDDNNSNNSKNNSYSDSIELFAGIGSHLGQPGLVVSSTDHGQSWKEVFRHNSTEEQFTRIDNFVVQRINKDTTKVILFGKIHGECHYSEGDKCSFGAIVRYTTKNNDATSSSLSSRQVIPIVNMELPHEDARTISPRSKPPHLEPIVFHDTIYFVGWRHRPPDTSDSYTGTYRIRGDDDDDDEKKQEDGSGSSILSPSSPSLERIMPWPKIEGKPTQFRCWTTDSDPMKFLVLVVEPMSGTYAVFRTNGYFKHESGEDKGDEDDVWEKALTIEALPNDDEFLAMTFLRNDLYLSTVKGDLHVVHEFYEPLGDHLLDESDSEPDTILSYGAVVYLFLVGGMFSLMRVLYPLVRHMAAKRRKEYEVASPRLVDEFELEPLHVS
jgi:hypothetical protein